MADVWWHAIVPWLAVGLVVLMAAIVVERGAGQGGARPAAGDRPLGEIEAEAAAVARLAPVRPGGAGGQYDPDGAARAVEPADLS